MGARKVFCPRCGQKFVYETKMLGRLGGVLSGFAGGAAVGAQIGIAAGPWGAIAGTVPGGILGALGLGKLGKNWIDDPKCPICGTRFAPR